MEAQSQESERGQASQTSQTRLIVSNIDVESERLVRLALGQNEVLEKIATGAPLGEALTDLLRLIEGDTPEMACSILLLDASGIHLRAAAAPSLPPEYSKAIDGAVIGARAGSCGTAAYRREQVIVSDIETDPLWDGYRELARSHGLRACWSTPIFNSNRQVLGTFAMYFMSPGTPDAHQICMIQLAVHVAALAIGKDHRERELARLTNDLKERIKELTVQRRVAQELLIGRPIGQALFDSLVDILPSGWRYPDDCHARIVYGPWNAQSAGFSPGGCELQKEFRTSRGSGTITIAYPREIASRSRPPRSSMDPFFPEERQLMDSIAETITVYLNRAHAEAALEVSEERYRLINLATNDAVWDWDVGAGTLWWNDGVEALFGYPKDEVPTELGWWSDRLHPEDRKRVEESLHEAASTAKHGWLEEYRFRKKDGRYAHVQDRGHVMRDSAGQVIRMIGLMEDITERKRTESKIRDLAYCEPVTQLANRAALQLRVGDAIEAAQRRTHDLALLLLNLNCFRDVNDSLGHQNGDILLRRVAERLRDTVGPRGEVACLGGDEFAVLLPRVVGQAQVDATLEDILTAMEHPVQLGDIPIQIDATLGVALYPSHGTSAETLWQHADVALRTAKEKFETHLFYSSKFDHYDPMRLILLGELRSAIEEGQLALHYQPKIDLRTGRTVGVEALVRWQHSTRGLLFPDTFIPLAERSGLINPLTTAVVTGALRQGALFLGAGLPLDIAVNLSARNLHQAGFARQLLDVVSTMGFPLSRLTLEVTETAIMADPVRAKTVLAELQQTGIHISMDDFGIGHSSLSYLKELPITKMKIDKSFVMDFAQPKNLCVVRSAIDLARNMGLQITAEGVEEESTFLALRDLGCDIGQGYFFSRPLPVDRLTPWLQESPWGIAGKVATD
jgi:diguanylate cyclase (GGDEF)-like protein/PAS domain S-box-containing protein